MRGGIHWPGSCGSISSGDEEMCGKGFLFKQTNLLGWKENVTNVCIQGEDESTACKGSKQMLGWSQVAVTTC